MPRKATCLMSFDELMGLAQQDAKKPLNKNEKLQIERIRNEFQEMATGFDISVLYRANSKYSPEQRLFAVYAYVITGSARKASRLTGVEEGHLLSWKKTSPWWDDAVKEVRRVKGEQMDSMLTSLMHQTGGEMEDRLINGDEVVGRNGESYKKKVGFRELSYAMKVMSEQRALLRGEATSRREVKDSSGEAMKELRTKLEDLSRLHKAKEIPASYEEVTEAAKSIPVKEKEDGQE